MPRSPHTPFVTGKYVEQIRAARFRLGIGCREAARRAGWASHRHWQMKESIGPEASATVDTIAAMAEAVGLRLVLTDFTEEEERCLRELALWYERQDHRHMPRALVSVLAKIKAGKA